MFTNIFLDYFTYFEPKMFKKGRYESVYWGNVLKKIKKKKKKRNVTITYMMKNVN